MESHSMQHKHIKTFETRGHSDRERRLLRDKLERGAEITQNTDEWRQVFDHLRKAPYAKDDKKLQAFIADEDNLLLVASVVELPGGRTVDWLPDTARKFAKLYREEFTVNETETMKTLEKNMQTEVSGFMEKLK